MKNVLITLGVVLFVVSVNRFTNHYFQIRSDSSIVSNLIEDYPPTIPEGKEWIDISSNSFQSCNPPWQLQGITFTQFWENNDITFQAISSQGNPATCKGCNCPPNYKFEILIDSSDKDKVLKILEKY